MTRIAGLIATHNQVRYAESAVLSLLPEVDELIVVDDGSSDGSAELLAALSARHGFRLIINERARGVSEAYNAAVAETDADILLIQGGDDVSLPRRGARSVEALEDSTVTLAYSFPVVIDGESVVLPDDAAAEFFASADSVDPLARLFGVGNFVCAPSAAVRRSDYLAGGGFPSGIDLLQDYALWLELAARGRFERLVDPVVEYRKHGSNLSREYVGVDSARQRRYAAERSWILNRFLDRADESGLARIAPIPVPPRGTFDRAERALLVRLTHGDRSLVRRGLSDLFDLLDAEGDGALARLGLVRGDLDRFSTAADHDNLAELGRVEVVTRDLRSIADPPDNPPFAG